MELNGTGDVTGYGTIFLNAPTSNTFLFYVPLVKKYERTFLNYKTQHIFLGFFFFFVLSKLAQSEMFLPYIQAVPDSELGREVVLTDVSVIYSCASTTVRGSRSA